MSLWDTIYEFVVGKTTSAKDNSKVPPVSTLLESAAKAELSERTIAAISDSITNQRGILGVVVGFLSSLLFVGELVTISAGVALEKFRQRVLAAYQPTLPTIEQVQSLKQRKLIDEQQAESLLLLHGLPRELQLLTEPLYREWLNPRDIVFLWRQGKLAQQDAVGYIRNLGFSDTDVQRLFDTTIELLSPDEIIAAWFRGIIDDPDAKLRERGLRDADIAALKKISEFIPPAGDLIRFEHRNIFRPEITGPLRLDEGFEESWPRFEQWARNLGISKDVAKLYWMARWDPPSLEQSYVMFQRGIIDRDQLETIFKWQNILPLFRDKLLEKAYNPLTRVDIRRMYALGLLSDEQTVRAYMDLGYSQQNAENLLVFTKRLAQRSQDTKQGQARALSSQMVLSLYAEHLITREKATDLLKALHYDPDEVDLLLAHEDTKASLEIVREARQAVETLYTNGNMDAETAKAQLRAVGYTDESIDQLLQIWDLRRQAHARAAALREQKELTKAELIEAYNDRLIDAQTLGQHLQALGYDQTEAQTLVAIADYKRAKAERSRTIESIKTLYLHRARDDVELMRQLDALGLTQLERDAYITQWASERAANDAKKSQQEQKLTRTDIRKLIAGKIITSDEGRQLLKQDGYSDHQIDLLFTMWFSSTTTQRKKGG